MAFTVMQTGAYGVEDIDRIGADYQDIRNLDFLAAYEVDPQTNKPSIVSVYRIRRKINISCFSGLAACMNPFRHGQKSLADIGAYTTLPFGAGIEPFRGLFKLCVRFLQKHNINGMYIQSRNDPAQLRFFRKLGFQAVGAAFSAPGWGHRWVPMYLDIEGIYPQSQEKAFQMSWKEAHGVRFDSAIWRQDGMDGLAQPKELYKLSD